MARSAPLAASAMSLCASQMSPWVPRYAAPRSPPKISAAPHSKSSNIAEVESVKSSGRKYPQKPRTSATRRKNSRSG